MTLNTNTIMDAIVDTSFLCNKAGILRGHDMFYYTTGVQEEYETQHTFMTWQKNFTTELFQ
jgi:hypothetical protein